MWVHSSQTHLWRTIAPAFNEYGWAWIGPEEDKDNTPKPWLSTVTPKQRFTPGSIYDRWANDMPI